MTEKQTLHSERSLVNQVRDSAILLASALMLLVASLSTAQAAPTIGPSHHSKQPNFYNKSGHKYDRNSDNPYLNSQYLDSNGILNQDMIGPLLGAAIGGLLASKIGDGNGKLAATAAGTLLGYILGGKIRDYMDNNDRDQANQVLENSKNQHPVAWTNPDTQANYEITPVKTYKTDSGYCREFITSVTIDQKLEEINGTACRQPDGSWLVKN